MRSLPVRLVSAGATVLAVVAVGCVPPPPEPTVAIEMSPGAGFFAMPWPNDTRRSADGSLDLDGLPGVEPLPGEVTSPMRQRLPGLVREIGVSLDGFGVNAAVYFQARRSLEESSLPTPSDSVAPDSTVMMMNLDAPGERVPVIVDYQATGDRNRPDKFLSVLPYPGHPLDPSTRYAVAIFDGIELTSGRRPLPSPLIRRLDRPWVPESGLSESDWSTLRSQRDEVRAVIESTTGWDASDLLAFTVYTTQDVRRDATAVAAAIDRAPPPTVEVRHQTACDPDPRAAGAPTSKLTGVVELTRWQAGDYPYHFAGGEIVVGEGGSAVAQQRFPAEFTARVPCGPPPPAGWPLVVFVNGTGGGWDVDANSLPFDYGGFVYAQISPVYGEDRGISLTHELQQLGLTSLFEAQRFTMYNFLNPRSVRSNTIQQAAEFLELLQAMEHLEFDGAALGAPGTVTTDPTRQVVSGQSQGAQALPLVAALRPSLAGVISAAGGGAIHHTISHGVFNRNFLGSLTGDPQVLDELNPIIQLASAVVDGGDGINFPSDTHYLQYHGRDDCVPEYGRYAAGAIGLDLVHWSSPAGTYGDPSMEPLATELPATANRGGSTRVALERPGGHFLAFDQVAVNTGFLSDLAAGTTPTVPADGYQFGWFSSLVCQGERWDVPPTRFAR